MKLISLNIERNLHTETVLSFLKKEKPDVVCLQEILEEEFVFYKNELNLDGIFQAENYVRGPKYPALLGKKDGVAIFSKNIVDSGTVFYYREEENTLRTFNKHMSDEKDKRNYALVWISTKDDSGKLYKFITAHLPVTKDGATTPFQLKVLDSFLVQTEKLGDFVLCGDTNAPRGQEAFSRLAEKYKDNIPKEYKTSIDQNLHRDKGIQCMVDVLFTTPSYKASNVKLVDGLSDHMAVVADISQ